LAWTNPTTRSTGNTITASIWNADVVDNLDWLAHESSGGAPTACAYNSANFSVANNTLTAVTLNSERWDIGACHSTVTNTSRLTVPAGGGGLYEIGACLQYAANATGIRSTSLRLNGTTTIWAVSDNNLSANAITHTLHRIYRLAASDYVEVCAYQTSGGNLNVEAASNYSPELYFRWCGV
jgi:hypothetical protein